MLQILNWQMSCVERTPSVYFHFEDTAKRTDLSEDLLFELSCTHQKNGVRQDPPVTKPVPLCLNYEISHTKTNTKVKTDEFFDEFDNNFVVTFEEENKLSSQVSTNAQNNLVRQQTDPDETGSKISLFHKNSIDFKEDAKSHILSQQPTLIIHEKEKSPIPSFSVKKRTVFKSKENIQGRNQYFKLTKKKIFNKDTLEIFAAQSKSCKVNIEKRVEKGLFLTQRLGKFGDSQAIGGKRKYKSTIFQREQQNERRPNTLQNRKHIFERLRQNILEKTVKRNHNIFKKPFSNY